MALKDDSKPLTGLYHLKLKTERAKQHLDAIEAELRKAFRPQPYTITRHDYPKKLMHVIRIEMKPIPIASPCSLVSLLIVFDLAWINSLGSLLD